MLSKRNMGDSYLLEKERQRIEKNTEYMVSIQFSPGRHVAWGRYCCLCPIVITHLFLARVPALLMYWAAKCFPETGYGLKVNLDWSAPTVVNPFPLPVTSRGMGISYEGKSSAEPLERDRRKEAVSLVLEHYCVRISLLQLLHYFASLKDKGM